MTTPNTTGLPSTAAEKSTKPPAAAPQSADPLHFKSPLVNPAWAEELAVSFCLTGPLAKEVAAKVSVAIAEAIVAKYTRAKLAKLVRNAVNKTIV